MKYFIFVIAVTSATEVIELKKCYHAKMIQLSEECCGVEDHELSMLYTSDDGEQIQNCSNVRALYNTSECCNTVNGLQSDLAKNYSLASSDGLEQTVTDSPPPPSKLSSSSPPPPTSSTCMCPESYPECFDTATAAAQNLAGWEDFKCYDSWRIGSTCLDENGNGICTEHYSG